MRPSSSLHLVVLVVIGCGEPTTLPPGDSGPSEACDAQLAAWDASHPLPDDTLTVLLDPSLWVASPPEAADGDLGTEHRGTLPEDVLLSLSEPIDVRGVRHHPAASGGAISRYQVFLGDDAGCDALAGEAVVDMGPFYEDVELTPRVASAVRIAVLATHDGGAEYGVADFEILAGADFETEPMLTARVDVPWRWDAHARIPGVGTVDYSTTSAPGGLTIDAAGILDWTPHVSQVGDHVVNVVAQRGDAIIERRFVLTVAP